MSMETGVLWHADIDTRRALGVYGRLPKSSFVPRPIPSLTFRYWPEKNIVIYIDFDPTSYEFTVYREITRYGHVWTAGETMSTWKSNMGEYSFKYACTPFRFSGTPDVVHP